MRNVIVFFLSLNLFLTQAFARIETPDQENYNGIFTPDSPVTFHEIRYLYPDHIIQRHITELSHYLKNHYLGTPGDALTQKNLDFFESLKTTPYIEEMEMRDPQGNSIDMNIRVRISRYQQYAIIHYELPHSNTIYVEVPPQLLNDVDMNFMDQHLMEEYGQAKPKKVVVFSDHLPSFENFLETYKKLTLNQVDRLMKSLIMSLDYNRQLTHVTEKMIQEMIQKKIFFDSIVESSTQTMDVELAAGLIQMRDNAIDFLNRETQQIWNELKKTNPETPYTKAQDLLLKKNKNSNFVLPDDSLARIEITTIEDEYVIRILLHGSEKVFLWVSSDMVQKNSKHFQLFLARQHMTAGTDRTDGIIGRDVILLYFDKPPTSTENQKTLKVEERSKPTTISGKISAKSKSIFKAPQLKDQGFALFCGITQAGIMSAVNLAGMAYDPTFQFNAATVAVIFVFGWGIGSVPSTYNNWVYPKVSKIEPPWKTRMRQTLKASIISSLYVVAISYVIGDIKTMSDLYTAGSTALVMGYVLDRMSNVIINSFMRTEVNQWAVILKERSLDRSLHEVKIPFTNTILWKTPVSKAQWNQNVRSNSLNIMLRSPHLLRFPYGREVYFGSYFLVKYLTLKWAQWKHPDIAYKMRLKEKFDNINPLNIKFWKNIPAVLYSPVQMLQDKKSAKEIAAKTNEIIKSAATRPLNTCRLIFNFHSK